MKVSQSIRLVHSELDEYAKLLGQEVGTLLNDLVNEKKWSFSFRRKGLISFAQKMEMGLYSSKEDVDDFYACEIVVLSLKDINSAKNFIYSMFDVIEERPKSISRAEEFTFDGVRLYAKLPSSVAGPKTMSWMTFEIQIKTLLEKAWAEATHDFTYKCKEVGWGKDRLVSQIKAILNHADIILAETETIAGNCLPSVDSTFHNKINEISNWVLDKWPENACPDNMKRLSETISSILKSYHISFEDLKEIVENYKKSEGAYLNLSVYALIVEALLNCTNASFWKKAKKEHKRQEHRFLITPDMNITETALTRIHSSRCIFSNDLLNDLEKTLPSLDGG